MYDAIDIAVWKERVHFIAKQLGVTNRMDMVFISDQARNITPDPLKWHANNRLIVK